MWGVIATWPFALEGIRDSAKICHRAEVRQMPRKPA